MKEPKLFNKEFGKNNTLGESEQNAFPPTEKCWYTFKHTRTHQWFHMLFSILIQGYEWISISVHTMGIPTVASIHGYKEQRPF